MLEKGFCKHTIVARSRMGVVAWLLRYVHVHNGSMRAAKNYPTLSDNNMKTTIAKYSWGGLHIDLSYN